MRPTTYYQLHSFLVQFSGALCVGFYIPYLHHVGLEASDIFLINVVYWLIIAVTEVMTGAFADRLGRGRAVRCGLLLSAVGTAFYASAMLTRDRWMVMAIALISELLEGLGSSFMNGANQAWIADALKYGNREDELSGVLAKAAKWTSIGLVSGGAVSFLLAKGGYLLGWSSRTCAILIGLAVCAKWMNGDGEPKRRNPVLKSLRLSLSALKDSYGLKWMAAAAIAFGLVLPFNLTWVPHFKASLGDGLAATMWLVLNVGLIGGAYFVQRASWLSRRPGNGMPIAIIFTGVGLAMLGMVGGTAWPFLFVLIHELGRGMFAPLVDGYIYRRVGSEFKATYGSLHSMISRGGYAVALWLNWLAVRHMGETAADSTVWTAGGALLIVSAICLWLIRPRRCA